MNTRSLYKKRNITNKTYKYFKDNIHKYLSPNELSKLPHHNDLLKYKTYPKPTIDLPSKFKMDTRRVKHFIRLIKKQTPSMERYYTLDYPEIKVTYSKNENYKKFYMMRDCKKYDILNINKLATPFTFFSITPFQMNPSETHLLFGVDFIGNRSFHLFIKSIYSNEIKEIKIHSRAVVPTKDLLGNSNSNISDNFEWLNNDEIAYISQNQYYNQSGIYVYNLLKDTKYLLKKIPQGYFGNIYVTSDDNYAIINISDYNSDEIYIIDNENKLKSKLKPILSRKYSICYPFIDHIGGEWIIHETNKGLNTLKKTKDFQTYKIDYIDKNITQSITKVQYIDETYIFTVSHLKGCKLYTLKCGKLTLHVDEPTGYIRFNIKDMEHFKYSIYFYLTEPINSMHICINPNYYEKKIYIKKDLYFTVLSKKKPHLSKCLLFGYGSYNYAEIPSYSPHYLALILDGWTVIIAHLRGGGEYGYKGYDEGRLTNKPNTFIDFIETADYLVKTKITTHKKLAIWGRSAGGLLITNVINLRPDICEFAIIGVPFVSPIETMMTYKTPLGIESRSEFGDPTTPIELEKIKTYDPIRNIDLDKKYPNIFIYTNYYDTLVPYKEPLNYYNAMKEANVFKSNPNKENEKEIGIFIDKKFGHVQGSSMDSHVKSYAIIFDQLYRYIKD